MTRIVEHRSALPLGTVVEVHVHRGPVADAPVPATVDVTKFNSRLDLESFVDPVPVADAFLQALAYAERAGIACVWIDDPDGHFPPEKRPVHDVTASWQSLVQARAHDHHYIFDENNHLVKQSYRIAFLLVVFLRQTEGPFEFKGLGFEFNAASGQVAMWVVCFLAIVGAIKLLW
jgi:hypothetical protein